MADHTGAIRPTLEKEGCPAGFQWVPKSDVIDPAQAPPNLNANLIWTAALLPTD
jgi:hypothetical protein